MHKMAKYHIVIRASVFGNTEQKAEAKKEVVLYTNAISNRKRL